MNTIKDKTTTSFWFFKSHLVSIKKWFKNFFNNFICVTISHEFYVCTLWMHYTLSSKSLEEIKLINFTTWIFQEPYISRSFMSFKYGLISSRYSLIGSFFFQLQLLSYSMQLLFLKLSTVTGWWYSYFYCSKRFLIFLISLSLVDLF